MHTTLNLLLVLDFFLVPEVGLLRLQLVVLVGATLAQGVGRAAGKPGADVALDFEGDGLALLVPHRRRDVLARVDDLVVASVNVQAGFLHLNTEFAHHLRRFGFVLVSLHLAFNLVRMVVASLICLCECVVVSDTCTVVAETTKVGLGALLLLDSDCNDFDLIVGETNLDFELGRHLELICLNRVIVVLLLLSNLISLLRHHLLLHLLLLELL